MDEIMRKTKSGILIIFLILLLSIFIYQSYAKYRNKTPTDMDLDVVQWKILINDQNILGRKTLTEILNVTIEQNQYIKNNTVAPGSKGYFDVVIDSQDTTLPFSLKINTSILSPEGESDFKITGYKINDEQIEIDDPNAQLELNKIIQGNENETTIRYFIEWIDGENDTEHSTITTTIPIEINVKLKQYNG